VLCSNYIENSGKIGDTKAKVRVVRGYGAKIPGAKTGRMASCAREAGGGRDAAGTISWSFCAAKTPRPKSGRDAGFWPRKGLKRKYFFAVPGKKDWSGKPGFLRRSRKKCAQKRRKQKFPCPYPPDYEKVEKKLLP
jgi:hypothetical protein